MHAAVFLITTSLTTTFLPNTSAAGDSVPLSVEKMLIETSTAHIMPNAKDLPKGYGNVTCYPAETMTQSESSSKDYLIECGYNTSCGMQGTLFLYRTNARSTARPKMIFTEATSDYMGGYYQTVDLNNDGIDEVFIIPGSDGVALSHIRGRMRLPGTSGWKQLPCEGDCAAHDYVLIGKEMIGIRACADYLNEKDCKDRLIRITIEDSKIIGRAVELDSYPQSKMLLDRVFDAVVNEDRKEAERAYASLPILKHIHRQVSLPMKELPKTLAD